MAQDTGLAFRLCSCVIAFRVHIGPDGRDLDQPGDTLFRRDARHAFSAFGLDRIEPVLAAFGKDADTVDRRVRPLHRRPDGGIVPDIAQDRLDLPHDTIGPHEKRFVRAPHGHPYTPPRLCHTARDISPDEPRTAVDRHELGHRKPPAHACVRDRCTPAPPAGQGELYPCCARRPAMPAKICRFCPYRHNMRLTARPDIPKSRPHDTCPGGGMVDALASGASTGNGVEVRVLSWAPNFKKIFRSRDVLRSLSA